MPVRKRKAPQEEGSTSTTILKRNRASVGQVEITLEDAKCTKLGQVLAFGQGDVGQLGLGPDIMERNKPAVVQGLDDFVDISAGGMHTVCLNKNGEVYTFGCNDEGALGRDTSEENSETKPGKVNFDEKVIHISAGDSHSAVLLESGKVFAFGSFRDSHGSMGLTSNGIQKTAIQLLADKQVVKIASGNDHLVMLTNRGEVYTCGCPEQGQLGRVPERGASREARQGRGHLLSPGVVHFKGRLKIENIWTGSYTTFAKEYNKDNIYVFGLNNYSQIGLEDKRVQFFPVLSRSFTNIPRWKQICGGEHYTIGLTQDGKVYSIGRHNYGLLGLGPEKKEDAVLPTHVSNIKEKIKEIACGSWVSFAVNEKGEVYGWGMATNGQLALDDSEDDLWEPHLIKGKQLQTRSVMRASAGGQHTVLLAYPNEVEDK